MIIIDRARIFFVYCENSDNPLTIYTELIRWLIFEPIAGFIEEMLKL